ncbi:hypothetical protein [Emticicia sp. 17c]|uniref:hypothetical protein n=1 Tax=Emticicia sp. 17c TaxID=3127704 RepID=UPI00301D124C
MPSAIFTFSVKVSEISNEAFAYNGDYNSPYNRKLKNFLEEGYEIVQMQQSQPTADGFIAITLVLKK